MATLVRLLEEARRHPIAVARALAKRALEIPARGFPKLARDEEDDFDKRYGVETARIVQVVVTDSPNLVHGERYQTTREEIIRWCIENASIDPKTATFIDIGCGKGRALIVAAQYPFARVLGVEYSAELAEICDRNLQKAKCADRCAVLVEDAERFVLPEGNLLAFMYNPFKSPVLNKVLARLAAHPAAVVLAYRGPGLDVVEASGLFEEKLRRTGAVRIYRPIRRAQRAA